MNKIFLFIAALTLSLSNVVLAQNIQFEGVVGMNIANVDATGANSRIGFHVGARGTYAFQSQEQGIYANAAALLSLKGTKIVGITFNPYYLDIPVHVGYKYPVTENVAVFGEVGPDFGIGLFGRTEGADVFSDEIGYKRFDVGLGFRVGMEFLKKYDVSMGYDFGLMDVADDVSAKNRNIMISVGYKF